MKVSRLLPMVIVCLLLASCGSSDLKTDIVGEWKGQVVKQDLVFHADGRVEMQGYEHSVYYGTYSLDADNNLTCIFENLSEAVKCEAKISGTELKLTFPGREEIYHRK